MTLCKVCVRKYNHCRQSFNLKTLWENLNKVIFSKTGGALHLLKKKEYVVSSLAKKTEYSPFTYMSLVNFEIYEFLLCLMPLSTIFKLYCGRQFYWGRKPEYQEIL
jgi:uncharacterized protein YkuJ